MMCETAMEVDTKSDNAATTGCEKHGMWQDTLDPLGMTGEVAVDTDTICHNTAISACGERGRWQDTLELLGMMGKVAVETGTGFYTTPTLWRYSLGGVPHKKVPQKSSRGGYPPLRALEM